MKKEKTQKYFLGLSINPQSVGYAVTDTEYKLKKFNGEPLWGVTTFEEAEMKKDRRLFRSARRRINRTQQRIQLLSEIFAPEIAKIDKNFFIRRKESALFTEDTQFGNNIFEGAGLTDALYYKRYPTIHHLIYDLMTNPERHDPRLVYIACAWLLANRGHFLYSINADNISALLDFSTPFNEFCDYMRECGYSLPWPEGTSSTAIENIMRRKISIKEKKNAFKDEIFDGKEPSKKPSADFPFNKSKFIDLLSGKSLKLDSVFEKPDYHDLDSVSLSMSEESFLTVLSLIDESEATILQKLRNMADCVLLGDVVNNSSCISEAKVQVYDQHKADLQYLKYFIKKYAPNQYKNIFRHAEGDNYVAYSGNVSSCKKLSAKYHRVTQESFSKFILNIVREIKVQPEDIESHKDMVERLELNLFMPKQRNDTNRVVPQQMYRYELNIILKNALEYLPFLNKKDSDDLTPAQKILSIFDFKIPYFVGPLNSTSDFSWIVRKADKIYPWNFEDVVDFEATEQAFIKRMIGACTYLPWENVLPLNSLLYEKFAVLNDLNNLKINGNKISVELKQEIFTKLYQKTAKISKDNIKKFLVKNGYMSSDDSISGLCEKPSSLATHNKFLPFIKSKKLSEEDIEVIIYHSAYSEDKTRMREWLQANYPNLSAAEIIKISNFSLKEFGKLSKAFLQETLGKCKKTGEEFSIIEALWQTNDNLMQLLSDNYTFTENITQLSSWYYAAHPQKLEERMDEMYIPASARRPIFRTLDIIKDITKAMNGAPAKILIETSADKNKDTKKTREKSRKEKLSEQFKQAKENKDVAEIAFELNNMGKAADSKLRSDRVYLYFQQLGRCAYTGERIDFTKLNDGTYNIEHIYPRSISGDDNVEDNLILVRSDVNSGKSDTYPVSKTIQDKMRPFWNKLHDTKLMSNEKFARLVRTTPLSDEEKMSFIMRFFNAPHSTKKIVSLLQYKYPNTEIICINKDLMFEFRQNISVLRTVSINELYHAKDAYLALVVGNVYYEKFTRKWFNIRNGYNIKVESVFSKTQSNDGEVFWHGEEDIEKVKSILRKNAIHYTRYQFRRHGELFDQLPKRRGQTDLTPRKKDLDIAKYGGYDKATVAVFVPAKLVTANKVYNQLIAIDLQKMKQFEADPISVIRKKAENILKEPVLKIQLPLGNRVIKSNTVFLFDDGHYRLRYYISGKTGPSVLLHILSPLLLSREEEQYIKLIESFLDKMKRNKFLVFDEKRDRLSAAQNCALYDKLAQKLDTVYKNMPANQYQCLTAGKEKFEALPVDEQAKCLQQIIALFNQNSSNSDLANIGGAKSAGEKTINANIDIWKKKYSDVRIVDSSASGIFETVSENLLKLF